MHAACGIGLGSLAYSPASPRQIPMDFLPEGRQDDILSRIGELC